MKMLFVLIFLSFVTACSHPIEIVGEGDTAKLTRPARQYSDEYLQASPIPSLL
jgi:hypothetical protein